MSVRRIITLLLLLFVGGSIITLVVRQLRGRGSDTARATEQKAAAEGTARTETVVYYFYGTFRCATCRAIEAYARQAVEGGFQNEIRDGRLKWRPVNVEAPENTHFIEDFGLVSRSLILAELRDGQVVRWRNLDQIWYVVGDRETFIAYVQDETRTFMQAAGR